MAHPAAPSIYGPRPGPQTALLGLAASLAAAASAAAQVAPPLPPPPLPPPPSGDLAQRTLAAGQAMERSAIALAGQGPADRERACSAFYLAQVAYARAVELGINSAEAEIDRVETLKQSLGCEASADHAPAGPPGP
jgi:hypothetical protein